jgi:anaerobic selenocysteine-containing dehydrogenase
MNERPFVWNPEGKLPGAETGIEVKKTICSICNPLSHCGIDAYVKDGVVVKVEGSMENPHNAGTLCAKGAASRQYIYHPDRLRTPLLKKSDRKSGRFEAVSWENALDVMATRITRIKEESGPESVVFYAGYPKWMRPFLKRLAHGFGSPNYCSESSTCSAAAAMATRLNYGAAGRPEIDKAQCLLVWSTNPFYSNTSAVRRLLDARERGLKIIEVGPLITPLTGHADIHLRMRPGTSGALALTMANVIIQEGLFDRDFVENWTVGFEEFRAYVRTFPPSVGEDITGVPAPLIARAARLYATSKPAGLLSGANATVHHTNGVQNHRALTALIGLTGNFDREGGNYVVPPTYLYVPTGLTTRQHQFEQPRPWEEMAPRIGQDAHPVWCKMVPEAQAVHLPFQIRSRTPYPVRAMVAFGLNHRMWPGSDFMRESLEMLDFLVEVDLFMTDSASSADLVLPACSSFERSELKFYPEKYVIWTSPLIKPLGESRSDADIIFDLAARIAPGDALMQKGYEACVDWILEPTDLRVEELRKYPAGCSLKETGMPPYRKYEKGGFATPSGKMEFSSGILKEQGVDPLPRYEEPRESPRSSPGLARDYPLIFTTGARLPMYIHSRTFRLAWTKGLRPDPMVDMNPKDARERGISHGDPVTLSTRRGAIRVLANLTEIVPPGVVNMYHAYPEADVNVLIEPDYVDPISGYPGFKSLLCQVKKI